MKAIRHLQVINWLHVQAKCIYVHVYGTQNAVTDYQYSLAIYVDIILPSVPLSRPRPLHTSSKRTSFPSYFLELVKNPHEGFSAGLIDEDNIYKWEILIMGPPDTF